MGESLVMSAEATWANHSCLVSCQLPERRRGEREERGGGANYSHITYSLIDTAVTCNSEFLKMTHRSILQSFG